MILRIGQAPIPFLGKIKPLMPSGTDRPLGRDCATTGHLEGIGNRALKGGDLDALSLGRDLHGPIIAMGIAVKIAVIDKRLQGQRHRFTSVAHGVADIGGIAARFHPNPLLKAHISTGIAPDGGCAFEVKLFEVEIAVGVKGLICPAVGKEGEGVACILDAGVYFTDEQGAAEGRVEGGDQQTMVATGEQACDRTSGEAACAVGDKPFALFGGG